MCFAMVSRFSLASIVHFAQCPVEWEACRIVNETPY